jgi:hypothetical protein
MSVNESIYELKRPFNISDSSGEQLVDAVVLGMPKANGRTQESVVEFYSFLQSSQLRGVVALQRDMKAPTQDAPEPSGKDVTEPTDAEAAEALSAQVSAFLLQCSYGSDAFQVDLVKKYRVLARKCPEIATFNSTPLADLHYNSMGVHDLVTLAATFAVVFTQA